MTIKQNLSQIFLSVPPKQNGKNTNKTWIEKTFFPKRKCVPACQKIKRGTFYRKILATEEPVVNPGHFHSKTLSSHTKEVWVACAGAWVINHHSWVAVDKRSLFVLKVLFFCF